MRSVLIPALAAAALSPCAHGASIYAATSVGLVEIDVDAVGGPAATLIDGAVNTFSIAGGPATDRLYVQQFGGDILDYDVNTLSGVTTGANIGGATFGEGLDGFWYASETVGNGLDRVTPGSPAPGVYLGDGPHFYAGDLAASNSAVLYGSSGDGVVIVDKTDGSQTLLPGSITNLWGLAFTIDGRFFGALGSGAVYELDPNTGAGTFLGNVPYQIYDLASERGVPSPGALTLLAPAAVVATRRRR
jgi:hypothetical protein